MTLNRANYVANEPEHFSDDDLIAASMRLRQELERYQLSVEIIQQERKKREAKKLEKLA